MFFGVILISLLLLMNCNVFFNVRICGLFIVCVWFFVVECMLVWCFVLVMLIVKLFLWLCLLIIIFL